MKSKKPKVDKPNTSSNILDHVTLKDMPKVGDKYYLKDTNWLTDGCEYEVIKVDIVHRDGVILDGIIVVKYPAWRKDTKPHHYSLKNFIKEFETYAGAWRNRCDKAKKS